MDWTQAFEYGQNPIPKNLFSSSKKMKWLWWKVFIWGNCLTSICCPHSSWWSTESNNLTHAYISWRQRNVLQIYLYLHAQTEIFCTCIQLKCFHFKTTFWYQEKICLQILQAKIKFMVYYSVCLCQSSSLKTDWWVFSVVYLDGSRARVARIEL